MTIGLSFSFCILDIARGKIPYRSVTRIVARTRFRDAEEFNDLIARLRTGLWAEYPALCERIARELRIEGKIAQPRLEGGLVPCFRPGCHWVAHEDFIRWEKSEKDPVVA